MEELIKGWLCGMRTRKIKDNFKMSAISSWKNRVASYCDEKNEERAGFRKKIRT